MDKKCILLDTCAFFNDAIALEMPAIAESLKRRYCLGGNHEECARFQIYLVLGREAVPQGLIPSQVDEAEAIIKHAR